MKQTLIIRLSGIAFVVASAGVVADAYRVLGPDVTIGTMMLAMLLGASGLALFLRRQAGWWTAGLGVLGVLVILGSNLFYPTDTFAWMFPLGVGAVGLALLPAGRLARLASLVWLVGGILGLPPVPSPSGGLGFIFFGVALLLLGYVLWTEADSRETATVLAGP
jgi:hypothetical protein